MKIFKDILVFIWSNSCTKNTEGISKDISGEIPEGMPRINLGIIPEEKP